MTAKRFTVKQRQGATNYSINDYYGELPLNEGMYYKSNADKLCEWLNTQHELLNTLYNENEQLKSSDTITDLETEIMNLKEENKFLRNKVATYKSGNALLKKTLDKEWK